MPNVSDAERTKHGRYATTRSVYQAKMTPVPEGQPQMSPFPLKGFADANIRHRHKYNDSYSSSSSLSSPKLSSPGHDVKDTHGSKQQPFTTRTSSTSFVPFYNVPPSGSSHFDLHTPTTPTTPKGFSPAATKNPVAPSSHSVRHHGNYPIPYAASGTGSFDSHSGERHPLKLKASLGRVSGRLVSHEEMVSEISSSSKFDRRGRRQLSPTPATTTTVASEGLSPSSTTAAQLKQTPSFFPVTHLETAATDARSRSLSPPSLSSRNISFPSDVAGDSSRRSESIPLPLASPLAHRDHTNNNDTSPSSLVEPHGVTASTAPPLSFAAVLAGPRQTQSVAQLPTFSQKMKQNKGMPPKSVAEAIHNASLPFIAMGGRVASSRFAYESSRQIDVSQITESHVVIREEVVEKEVRVPRKVVREDIVEHEMIIPERRVQEEVIEEVKRFREKIVEVRKRVVQEKIVEVPTVEYVEKIVEVPEKIIQEKIIEVPKITIEERIIEVPKIVKQEKIVEVAEIEYRDVPVEKVVEKVVQEIENRIVEVPIPRYIDKPVPEFVTTEILSEVSRCVPVPVELVTTYEFRLPKLRPKYVQVPLIVYSPRFVEVGIPSDVLTESQRVQCAHMANEVASLAYATSRQAVPLSEIERIGKNAERTSTTLKSQLSNNTSELIFNAFHSGSYSIVGEHCLQTLSPAAKEGILAQQTSRRCKESSLKGSNDRITPPHEDSQWTMLPSPVDDSHASRCNSDDRPRSISPNPVSSSTSISSDPMLRPRSIPSCSVDQSIASNPPKPTGALSSRSKSAASSECSSPHGHSSSDHLENSFHTTPTTANMGAQPPVASKPPKVFSDSQAQAFDAVVKAFGLTALEQFKALVDGTHHMTNSSKITNDDGSGLLSVDVERGVLATQNWEVDLSDKERCPSFGAKKSSEGN